MKKLKLKNLKVVKLNKEEKKIVKGGGGSDCTTVSSDRPSGPYISWCNGCGEEDH